MGRTRPDASSPLAVGALLAANAVPLVGVVFFGWSLGLILVVYWVESGVIGALNVPKILLAAGSEAPASMTARINGRKLDLSGPAEPRDGLHLYRENGTIAGFFVAHYGVFWIVHGVFVLTMFAPPLGTPGLRLSAVALGVVGMVASHAGSFLVNFVGHEEYRSTSPGLQMNEPYRRVVVLHLTIILGAFGTAAAGAPLFALVLLVGLKTATDLYSHAREHRRASERRETASSPGERAERETNLST